MKMRGSLILGVTGLILAFRCMATALAGEWYDTPFVSPMFLSTVQLYGINNNEEVALADGMRANYSANTTDNGTKYTISGNRMGVIARHALRDFDVQVGLIMLRDDVSITRNDNMPASTTYYPVKEARHTDDLSVSPFVLFHPLANLHLSLKFDAHDYSATDSVSYKATGAQTINASAPAYKRGYNRVTPGISWTSEHLRLLAEYAPQININDDNGIINLPRSINLGAQYLISNNLRLDSAFSWLEWNALYTTFNNQWNATLGTRWNASPAWALAGYVTYSPAFARHPENLIIDNLETLDMAMHLEYQWPANFISTVMIQYEQGSGWSQDSSTTNSARTNYKRSREDLVTQLSYRY